MTARRAGTVAHPDDPGVLLGAVGALRPGVADAVVSLCRLGSEQAPLDGVAAGDHVEVWLVDRDDANLDLPRVITDAATAVRDLRAEGSRCCCTASGRRAGRRSSQRRTAR